MALNQRLPETTVDNLSSSRIREELIRVQVELGFRLFGNAINNRLDDLDVLLNSTTDREKLATAAIQRQVLASLVSDYFQSIELPEPGEYESPTEA